MQLHLTPLLNWYKHNGRNLPWRKTNDAYKIWVSEIFLQQTQVNRVIEYYEKMLEKYPTVQDLAQSDWEEFFPYFKGLGFYSRGKNMLKCSKEIVELHNSVFPNDPKILESLSGIGEYTAHAIASFAYKKSVPALDVNLYRVLGRVLDMHENIPKAENKAELIKNITHVAFDYFAKQTGEDAHVFNHALMDIGSTFCTAKKIDCENCPLKNNCLFFRKKKTLTAVRNNNLKNIKNSKNMSNIFEGVISVFMLRNNKKYLLECNEKNNFWKFPEFTRIDKQNNRDFLKQIIHETFSIDISVRPVFWKEEIQNKSKKYLYEFSRCQIQSGEKNFLLDIEKHHKYKFFTLSEIIELYENKKMKLYSEEFYEKIINMRI